MAKTFICNIKPTFIMEGELDEIGGPSGNTLPLNPRELIISAKKATLKINLIKDDVIFSYSVNISIDKTRVDILDESVKIYASPNRDTGGPS